jgi:hypothetical protein
LLKRIKKYFAAKRIQKAIDANLRNGYVKLSEVKSLCLVINSEEYDIGKGLDSLLALIKAEIPSVSRLDIIAYTAQKEKKFTPKILAFQKRKGVHLVQNKHFGFSYSLRHPKLKELLPKKKFDALIVFNKSEHLGIKRLVSEIVSKFNVGYHSESNLEIFDFMMKSDLKILAFGKEIVRYLKLIDDKS